MIFLKNLPNRIKEEATKVYNKAFEKNKKTMNIRLAHKEARNELQKFISKEYNRKRES
jgi:hypothetical protein